MTTEAAAEDVERLTLVAGVSCDWSGHSLRRGFATAAPAADRKRPAG
jgi:site-specific recombinase XerD